MSIINGSTPMKKDLWAQCQEQAISMLWSLLYLPVLVFAVIVPLVGYDAIPEQVAMHAGFDGQVNGYAEKSILTVMFPALMDVFLIACFMFSHFSIRHSKKANEPGSPRTSEYAYGMFARAESILLVASGLLICIAMTAGLLFSFFGRISLMTAANSSSSPWSPLSRVRWSSPWSTGRTAPSSTRRWGSRPSCSAATTATGSSASPTSTPTTRRCSSPSALA